MQSGIFHSTGLGRRWVSLLRGGGGGLGGSGQEAIHVCFTGKGVGGNQVNKGMYSSL